MSQRQAAERRRLAASKYLPDHVTLLLVAETPPSSLDRYFYFDDVTVHDSLFRYVTKMVLGIPGQRADKIDALTRLRDAGVFLIDIKPDPFDHTPLRHLVGPLLARCSELQPDQIVLIKTSVYDAAFSPMRAAGLPVIDRRIPFPGSGQQLRFEAEFSEALRDAELTTPAPIPVVIPPARASAREPRASKGAHTTLHDEIVRILREQGGWMTTAEIADRVNAAGYYRKGDGTPVTTFQIHGRTRKYPTLFERDASRVGLRT